MLEGPLVFVDVDTQRDFLEPGGALFIAGSSGIRPNLARLTAHARSRGIPILATSCAHAEGDPEFATFPPHCLLGTLGQTRIEETDWPDGPIVAEGDAVPASIAPHLTIHKRAYDVFSVPEADRVVELYSADGPTFVVYGVATDYCVRCAVEGLLKRGRKVALVVDAIRAVDPDSESGLLTEFARSGALLTVTDVVCVN
jgi:nicotinamidase/pyrazinamidase